MGEKSGSKFRPLVIASLLGVAIAVLVTLVLLMGVTALTLGGLIDGSSSGVMVNIAAGIGALVGGLVASRRSGAGALICAATVAIPEFLICMLVGLMFYENFLPMNGGVALAAAMIAGALVGTLLGSRRGGSKARRKK